MHRNARFETHANRHRANILTQHDRDLFARRLHVATRHERMRSADRRVTSERHFEFRCENPHAPSVRRIVRCKNKRRLRVIELTRNGLQRLRREPLGAGHVIAGRRPQVNTIF